MVVASQQKTGISARKSTSDQYDAAYYESHLGGIPYDRSCPHWLEFFGKLADEIVARVKPKRVLDVGCAKGFLVECLRDRGVEAFGFDVSEHAISQVRPDIARFCWVGSVTDPIQQNYDLITCIEVLEHVPYPEAQVAVEQITSHAGSVLFSSTHDDFNEPTHENVQPLINWLTLFSEFSFGPDFDFDISFSIPHASLLTRCVEPPSQQVLRLCARDKNRALALSRLSVEAATLRAAKMNLEATISDLKAKLASNNVLIAAREAQLANQDAVIANRDVIIADQRIELEKARDKAKRSEDLLRQVLNSKGWRFLNKFRAARTYARQLPSSLRLLITQPTVAAPKERPALFETDYQRWIERHEPPQWDPDLVQQAMAAFSYTPMISLIMPVYDTPTELLLKAIESARHQCYPNWELCICDDGSKNEEVRSVLKQASLVDKRIKVVFSPRNEGISIASNHAIEIATGEFIGLLDHDDELSPYALFEVVKLLQTHPLADMIYSDEDKLGADGQRRDPFFKPDWSPEYLLSCMYTCHFGVYRRSVINKIGGFRAGFEGSQDYDLVLRISEQTQSILHIPKILYHWRMIQGSAAAAGDAKPYAFIAAKKALAEHAARMGRAAKVLESGTLGHYRVKFRLNAPPKVSIVIPTRDRLEMLERCISSIEQVTDYPHYEIVIIDNQSCDPRTLQYLEHLPHRIVRQAEAFNFSKLVNFGVANSTGEYVVLLNNDTEIISEEWLSAMLEYCQQKEIGAVGAKLLYPDRRLQHIGVILGLGGVAGHPLSGHPDITGQQFNVAGDIRNCSAVTAACMMVRNEIYQEVGGFDEGLAVAFNDVDFCLKIRQRGYRIVWTPYSVLYHHESASRGYHVSQQEVERMKQRWADVLNADPFYNPNLSLAHGAGYKLRN